MKKAIFIGVGLLVLVLWWDVVLELLADLLELTLETLGLITERALEAVLALTPYEAKAVAAWLGLGLFVLLVIVVLRKIAAVTQRLQVTAPVWWEEEKVRLRAMRSSLGWPLVLIVLLTALIFFLYL